MTPIARYEHYYTIAPDGGVLSLRSNRFITHTLGSQGYPVVTLIGPPEPRRQCQVHRLVALHYLPNPYQHPVVNHIDGNKTNPHVTNLEWVDHEGNAQHAGATGLWRSRGYMSPEDKEALLHRVLAGEQVNALAKKTKRRAETLHRMLREQAKKLGIHDQWTAQMKRNRHAASLRNIAALHVDALTPAQIAVLFQRACAGERIIDLAVEVNRHPATLGALLRTYRRDHNIDIDFRRGNNYGHRNDS